MKTTGHDSRVRLMTFSEFGRRVKENGSRGTDHGAASCLFVAGPSVKGGVVGKHPSLADLDADDLKFHTDFRRVYATLLDDWLGATARPCWAGSGTTSRNWHTRHKWKKVEQRDLTEMGTRGV